MSELSAAEEGGKAPSENASIESTNLIVDSVQINLDTAINGSERPPVYTEPKESQAEAPPSYNSLFGQVEKVRDAAKNSDGKVDMVKNVVALTLCSTACVIIFTCLMIGVPVAMIVMGSINLNNCPRERFIPIYLIVGGVFGVIRGLQNMGCHIKKRKQKDQGEEGPCKGGDPCGHVIDCFLTAWFIAGCVWIYRIHMDYQSTNPLLPNYCDQTLYLFAFWVTTASFIFMAFAFTCCCCIMCVACCAAAGAAKK